MKGVPRYDDIATLPDSVELDLKNRGGRIRQILEGKSGLPDDVVAKYRARWGAWPDKITITKAEMIDQIREWQAPPLPCVHRGETIRSEPCKACGGRDVLFAVFACEVHKECSLLKRSSKLQVCLSCADRLPPEKNHQP